MSTWNQNGHWIGIGREKMALIYGCQRSKVRQKCEWVRWKWNVHRNVLNEEKNSTRIYIMMIAFGENDSWSLKGEEEEMKKNILRPQFVWSMMKYIIIMNLLIVSKLDESPSWWLENIAPSDHSNIHLKTFNSWWQAFFAFYWPQACPFYSFHHIL